MCVVVTSDDPSVLFLLGLGRVRSSLACVAVNGCGECPNLMRVRVGMELFCVW